MRGVLVPQIIANLQLGGVSTTQILRTYREFGQIALAAGEPISGILRGEQRYSSEATGRSERWFNGRDRIDPDT